MKTRPWNKFDPCSVIRSGSLWATVAVSVLVLSGCVTGPKVPSILQVAAGQKVLLHAYAKGVQIYGCESSSTEPGNFAWKLKAPEATLFEVCGSVIGSHYSGPTWENDRDGSKVGGEVLQRSDSPLPTGIPWLLVRAKPAVGPGRFHDVTYIQQVNTIGGLAPTTIADAAHLGMESRVPFTAEYYFYRDAHRSQ